MSIHHSGILAYIVEIWRVLWRMEEIVKAVVIGILTVVIAALNKDNNDKEQ